MPAVLLSKWSLKRSKDAFVFYFIRDNISLKCKKTYYLQRNLKILLSVITLKIRIKKGKKEKRGKNFLSFFKKIDFFEKKC